LGIGELTEIGKDAVEGQYFSTHYHPDVGSELSQSSWRLPQAWNGKNPDALAACGYDSSTGAG
jgi:branched-chain amino acid transport system substrate-binding protein